MLDVVKGLRKTAGFETDLIKRYLCDLGDAHDLVSDPSVTSYVNKVINHSLSELGKEKSVVLTLDGSNVAGLQSTVQGFYPLTLTHNLVTSFLHHVHNKQTTLPFGTKGFWDSIPSPKVYTLSDLPSLATDALIHGGIDGFILGSKVSTSNHHERSLSDLLKSYYGHQFDAPGMDASPHLINQKRRMNFKSEGLTGTSRGKTKEQTESGGGGGGRGRLVWNTGNSELGRTSGDVGVSEGSGDAGDLADFRAEGNQWRQEKQGIKLFQNIS
uniref:Peptidoglycan recognition protein 6 n=1 Tax=Cyprinus carpio TaxID=7962 RepID=A0A8C2G8A5_CYPCA